MDFQRGFGLYCWLLASSAVLIVAGIAWYIFASNGAQVTDVTAPPDAVRSTSPKAEGSQPGSSTRNLGSSTRAPSTSDAIATFATATTQSRLDDDSQLMNPRLDGWDSEAFNEDAGAQLKKVGKLILQPELRDAAHLSELVTEDFTCAALRPRQLDEAYRDGSTTVRRGLDEAQELTKDVRGTAALAQALAPFDKLLDGNRKPYVKFKVIQVELAAESARTPAYFEVRRVKDGGSVFVTATWHCQWKPSANSLPRLKSIVVENHEEVVVSAPSGTWFADCTQSVLASNKSFREQLMFGTNHWANVIDKTHLMELFSWYGVSVGDTNGDGLEDVYVCQGGGLPNCLFVQNPDGTATDQSTRAGVDWLDLTRTALMVDLDNDDDQDLLIGLPPAVLVMLNDGTGRYQLQRTLTVKHPDIQSITAADYDLDGDLDIYVGIARATGLLSPQSTGEFVFHDANDGGANRLYRNDLAADGHLEFVDVTEQVGLEVHNRRHTLSVAWEDYDNDGDSDIYVANDYGQNCLYRNDAVEGQRRFVEVAAEAGVVDQGPGMSVGWGDYDRDGNMDLYVANMFSSAGNRITRQTQFLNDDNRNLRGVYRRFAKGNTLFAGLGDGKFQEVTGAAVEMGRWAWSSLFADINNDGWQDLLVANGFVTSDGAEDL
jgi:hypothetical protein